MTEATDALGGLADLFNTDKGAQRMTSILRDQGVTQIVINRHDAVFYTDSTGPKKAEGVFTGPAQYKAWLNELLTLTDAGYTDVSAAQASVIEGSFDPIRTGLHGSIHVCTTELTRGEPALTVRKQPRGIVTLDMMLRHGMLDEAMVLFLQQCVRGRSNILISGGTGAGKTTMARALSAYIDPNQRIVSIEDIAELYLTDRLPNVVSLTAFKKVSPDGAVVRRVGLPELVEESLRMRGERIWVGEVRGSEALALVKAANSGHDGCITTIHADDSAQAGRQLLAYTMEGGMPEEVARDQAARAFQIVVQISKTRMDRRVISEITEVEPVREGVEQRRNPLWKYDPSTDSWKTLSQPTPRLLEMWARYGVNWSDMRPGRRR